MNQLFKGNWIESRSDLNFETTGDDKINSRCRRFRKILDQRHGNKYRPGLVISKTLFPVCEPMRDDLILQAIEIPGGNTPRDRKEQIGVLEV